ncbi:penicillin-binding transpeptidase domain-containing protein [Acutalibacter caecimuris]|uniref:penicillin-binding transpeptidase domain-containing protein n=1 Tax=Acutalibacter caecimuris TaxID=3093657 RepID=UPI002AC8ED6C|nr:penicillin-binding transpeptidase domain-containing protein [Acutalibacter sp. M00118]
MKTVGLRSFVLYILLLAFLGGAGWLLFGLVTQGSRWAMQPYNSHIYDEDATVTLGDIEDRDGQILATSREGRRVYSGDETTRLALLHTVGDTAGYISTSAQYTLRTQLTGYNLITGLNDTVFNRMGSQVRLTVDAEACAAAYSAMNGHNGGAIFYNYKTGDVLCKVSTPSYDPENVPPDIEENDAYRGAYLDNTLSGAFTPGSIFKLVTTLAAMEKWPDGWSGRTYACWGAEEIGGSEITCLGYHGELDIGGALGHSCNLYFAKLANDIGSADLQKTAEQLGFNQSLHFSGIATAPSEAKLEGANPNQLGWAGVGQYTLLANPYQMLTFMGAVAGGGTYVQPRLTEGGLFGGLGGARLLDSAQAANLKALMRSNVADYYGDALFPEGLQVCAKTGTGEVGETQAPNCWMVGFCDNETYPIAFAVVVEDTNNSLVEAGGVVNAALRQLIS